MLLLCLLAHIVLMGNFLVPYFMKRNLFLRTFFSVVYEISFTSAEGYFWFLFITGFQKADHDAALCCLLHLSCTWGSLSFLVMGLIVYKIWNISSNISSWLPPPPSSSLSNCTHIRVPRFPPVAH